jgi:DNA replication protein DnaC
MLIQPVIQQLQELRLRGMARALELQQQQPDLAHLSFEDRLGLLVQQETAERQSQRLHQRLRWARLPQPATLEDLDTRIPRGIDRSTLARISSLGWLDEHLNTLIIGATGMGKSFLACAIAHQACRSDRSVRYFRIARLADELAHVTALQRKSAFFRQLAKVELLVLDDFGLGALSDAAQRDLLEILDDRYDKMSTLVTSQLPVDQWHATFTDPTLADAILDRLVHNAYRLVLKGDSMRRHKQIKDSN